MLDTGDTEIRPAGHNWMATMKCNLKLGGSFPSEKSVGEHTGGWGLLQQKPWSPGPEHVQLCRNARCQVPSMGAREWHLVLFGGPQLLRPYRPHLVLDDFWVFPPK